MASDPELNETRRSFFSRQGLASLMWQPPGADETTTRLPHADDSQADTLVRDAYIKRLGLKMADGGHASWGTVRVLGKNVDAEIVSSEASFACLAADTELNLVAELLKANWRLRPPSVLLSVTGSAQDMALEPHLELLFKRGLAESARSTNAWVITGGTDSGVMALAGAAIAENSSARGELTPCIGIAPFRCVTGKDKLHGPGAGERTVSYRKVRANSTVSAALDPHHTHFLLVDNDKTPGFDEMWLGRDARCGRVQLWRKTSPWQILLQIVCPCLSLVRLKRNDLFPDLGGEGRSMSAVHAFTGLWYIPAVKRMVHLVSLTVFAILTVIVTLMPTCAPLGATFYCWAVYLVAYIMQECQQFLQGPSLWWRNMYNKVDAVLIVFLLAMAMMRVVISLHGNSAHTAVDLLDWIGQMQRVEVGLDLHVEAPLRPGWPWHAEAEMLSRRLDSEHQCSWSVALELYRTTAAVVMVFFAFRMLEWFTNDSEKGVLIEIISRMVDNLWHWIQIMVIFTLFIAIAMSILMENFKLTDAEEGIYLFGSLNLDLSAGGPFMAPFWGIFGFYEPADIARAPGSAFITPLIFWSYLLFALLLMTNLLIAMFNDTYVSVKAKSTEHFLMNRVLKLKGYLVQYVVPIPFNMPYMLWDLMWQGVASLGAYCRRAGRRPNAGVLGIKQTRVGIEPVQDLEKPLASPPKKVCFDLADDNEAANGNGAPRPLQRQGTLGRLEASRKLLRQNTRRQLATVRAVKNVRKEASTSVARSVDLTEAHARDRYLKQIEEEGATAADFSQLEVRLRRLEGALTAQLRELASQLEARPALPPRASGACAAQTPSPREMQSAVSGDETAPSRSAVVAGSPLMRFRRGREPSHRSPPPPPPPRPFL